MSRFYLGGFLLALAMVGGGAARQSRRFGTQSGNCGCQCSPTTLQDKYGRISGNCLSSYKGSLWCYVDSWTSPCTDLRKSSKSSKPWSYQACVTPDTNLCSNSVFPVGPSGLPSNYCFRNEDCKGQVFDGVWVCRNNKCEVQPLCLFGNCNTGLPSNYCFRNEDCKGQVFDGVWVCRNNKCEVQPLCLFGNCNTGSPIVAARGCGIVNGEERNVGDTWTDDCNNCVCRETGVATCTRRFCGNIPVLTPDLCAGKRCGEQCSTSLGLLQVVRYCQPDGSCGTNSRPSCTDITEIPFPSTIKCGGDEEHLPGDPGCCRKINDHSFVYCI